VTLVGAQSDPERRSLIRRLEEIEVLEGA
jgi:hypothetical protein